MSYFYEICNGNLMINSEKINSCQTDAKPMFD